MLPDNEETKNKIARLQELKQLKRKREREALALARRDYKCFAERVLRDEATGKPIQLAAIHKQWLDHMNWAWSNDLHAIILAPLGHGKSFHFAVGMPLFAFGQDTSLRIMLISANENIARGRLMLARDYIDNSDAYHQIFPNVRANADLGWTKSQLFLQRPTMSKDPSLIACGITSSIQGARTDIMILDDVSDAKNTLQQPRMRDIVFRMYTGQFLGRLVTGGKLVAIATRWHEDDLVGRILEDEDMRMRYAFLIQRVSEDFECIESETIVPSRLPKTKASHRAQLHKLYELAENGVI